MPLSRLEARGIRNLEPFRLDSLGRINLVVGPNGSGKTSLLEAIYLLGMGRSFRGTRIQPLVSLAADSCVVYAETRTTDKESPGSIGVSTTAAGRLETHVDRISGAGRAELARALPLQLINADTFGLIDDGPVARRQFMDWGAFHVKPTFMEDWRRAMRCLKQRNHLLRQARMGRGNIDEQELEGWSRGLVESGNRMDLVRRAYIEEFAPLFFDVLGRMLSLPGLALSYRSGWEGADNLEAALKESARTDRELGRTTTGPHRASIDIVMEGRPATDFLSRGQKKLVVAALKLAQGWHLARATGVRCTYLVDDLAAELDLEHRRAFLRVLDETSCQAFITAVDADEGLWQHLAGCRDLFHMEQGRILKAV